MYKILTRFIALVLLCAVSGYASAELVDDIVLKKDTTNNEIDATIKFNVPIQYVRHFPQQKSSYLTINFNSLDNSARDQWIDYETHRSPPSDFIYSFTVTTRDLREGPKVEIQFVRAAEYSVSAGSDNRSLVVHIKPVQPLPPVAPATTPAAMPTPQPIIVTVVSPLPVPAVGTAKAAPPVAAVTAAAATPPAPAAKVAAPSVPADAATQPKALPPQAMVSPTVASQTASPQTAVKSAPPVSEKTICRHFRKSPPRSCRGKYGTIPQSFAGGTNPARKQQSRHTDDQSAQRPVLRRTVRGD